MDFTKTTQKIEQLLKKSNHTLVVLPENPSVDHIASALAFKLLLAGVNKQVTVCGDNKKNTKLAFLPGFSQITEEPESQHNLVVTLKTSETKLEEVSYHTEDNVVHIYLKAKQGYFTPEDVSVSPDRYPVDLLVSIGAYSQDQLSLFFGKSPVDLIKLPKINIDRSHSNEYFGLENYVEHTAVSLTEAVFNLFLKMGLGTLTPDIATCLLTGVIASTHSFQDLQTTPHAFSFSADLINAGARQQEIIQSLFKTKDFSTLRLWGRALARMKTIQGMKIMYSFLSTQDFEKTESDPGAGGKIIEEFIENISDFDCICLIVELSEMKQVIYLAFHPSVSWQNVLHSLSAPLSFEEKDYGIIKVISAKLEMQDISAVENAFLQAFSNNLPSASEEN